MSKAYREWADHVARCPICDTDDTDECEKGRELRLKVQQAKPEDDEE